MPEIGSDILRFFIENPGSIRLIVNHPVVIKAFTALLAGICSLVILMLRKRTVSEEKWAMLFGYGFLAYVFSYAAQTICHIMDHRPFWRMLFAFLGSCANNLFFLAAARSLLGKKARPSGWMIGLGVLASGAGVLDEWLLPIWRLPDAVFSTYCLYMIGHATATNLSISRGKSGSWAIGAFCVAVFYCLIQLGIATNPLLVKAIKVSDAVQRLAAQTDLPAQPGLTSEEKKLEFLDRLGIASLIPLKFGLFLSAFLVLLRATFAEPFDSLLAGTEQGRKEFLTSEGILRTVGNSLGSDAVELMFRLPGYDGKWVMILRWQKLNDVSANRITLLNLAEDGLAEKILLNGEGIIRRNKQEYKIEKDGRVRSEREIKTIEVDASIIAVPLFFHGAVIGLIKAELRGNGRISKATIAHLHRVAAIASLAVQSKRELAATDQFSDRFAVWRVEQKAIDLEQAVEEITNLLHDVLSPLATVVEVGVGFHSYRKIAGQSRQAKFLRDNLQHNISEVASDLKRQGGGFIDVVEINMGVRLGEEDVQEEGYYIGKLALIVPAGQDDLSHPTLGANYLLRRTIGALTAEAILDVVRDHFSIVLKEFAINLNSQDTVNLLQWFKVVEESAQKVGLSWVVAENLRDKQSFGDPEWAQVVYDHYVPIDESSIVQPVITLDPPINNIQYIIPLNTKIRMWLGGGRKGIETWLVTSSPWRLFLERFSDIADSAATRLMAEIELQRLQMERAQEQGLATVAVTTETLFHQLVNMVRDIANPVSAINDALLAKDLNASEENADLIRSTHKASARLLDFAFEMINVTKLDGHRPCSLLEAARQSQRFFEDGLTRNQITLDIDVPDELVVDVPYHVASLAIANLVANAKDAIDKRGGNIRVEAGDVGDMICCSVTDNGPGIHQSVRDRLFKIGATTKKGSGGWGLYLVYRSLIENRGHIELTNPGPGATQFTIRFPKIR